MNNTKRASIILGEVLAKINEAKWAIPIENKPNSTAGRILEETSNTLRLLGRVLIPAREKEKECEIASDDLEKGSSLKFVPRGIGMDNCPCFVCGYDPGISIYLTNISAFIDSYNDGTTLIEWFGSKYSHLDYREYEPHSIQFKLGACANHKNNLFRLFAITKEYGRIRQCDIEECRKEQIASGQV